MEKIYGCDSGLKKGVKKTCITSPTWHSGKPMRITGFLISLISAVVYAVLWIVLSYVPIAGFAELLPLFNELSFIFVILVCGGFVILGIQYSSLTIVPKTVGDTIIFLDDGLHYRYVSGNRLCTYSINYKNIRTIMYNSKSKHIVIHCDYVYDSEEYFEENFFAYKKEIAMVTNNTSKGAVVIPMCFTNMESIFSILLRMSGISILRDDKKY